MAGARRLEYNCPDGHCDGHRIVRIFCKTADKQFR